MSLWNKKFYLKYVKKILQKTILKSGTIVPIIKGPLKGFKYVVNENSGWSAIYGGWEKESQQIYQKIIKQGQIVYDLGANTGIHSMLFAKLVGLQGQVYAFEPLPDNIKEIENVKKLNKLENIQLVKKAVANRCCAMAFNIAENNKQGSLCLDNSKSSLKVNATTLDRCIEEGMPLPDFIKIDIEGAESLALEGFVNSILKSYPIFSVELHTPEQDIKVGNFFKQYGYTMYRVNSELAQKISKNQKLQEITHTNLGYPNPEGVWGTIIAIPPQKRQIFSNHKNYKL